jgi:hypothetical protein
LWLEWLGHLNEKDMKLLTKWIIIKGMSLKNNEEKLPLYEGFVFKKQHYEPFPKEGKE